MGNFQKISRNNIPGVVVARARPGGPFIQPVGVHLEASTGAKQQPLARKHPYDKVAFVGVPQTKMNAKDKQCGLLDGLHRCLDADLVVIPDLAILHDVDALAADVDLAVSFLYIVLRGVDVATQTQLAAVQGFARHLEPKHCVRHVAAPAETVTLCVGQRLKIEQEEVHRALERIAREPASKLTVSVSKTSTSASGDIFFGDVRDVIAWACSVRRVENERGPKAIAPDGVAIV